MSRVVLDETPAFEQLIQLFSWGTRSLYACHYFNIAIVELLYVFTVCEYKTSHCDSDRVMPAVNVCNFN